jgi:hypothetical protein
VTAARAGQSEHMREQYASDQERPLGSFLVLMDGYGVLTAAHEHVLQRTE